MKYVILSFSLQVILIRTVVYSVMFVISLLANTATLVQMWRLRRRKSTINTLILHLAIADLFVTFFVLGGEAAWAYSVQWLAGTPMCKAYKYIQVGLNTYWRVLQIWTISIHIWLDATMGKAL